MAHLGKVLALTLLLVCRSQVSLADDADAKAQQFLRNAHTGVMMDASAWLSQDMLRSRNFNDFGGLEAIVESSTKQAKRYGGLKDIKVLGSRTQGSTRSVTLQVLFVRDPRADPGAPTALKEPMIWEIKVLHESGELKLYF